MKKTWKKHLKTLLVLCLSICLAFCITACDGDGTTDPGETKAPDDTSVEQAFETLSPEEEEKDPAKNDIFS